MHVRSEVALQCIPSYRFLPLNSFRPHWQGKGQYRGYSSISYRAAQHSPIGFKKKITVHFHSNVSKVLPETSACFNQLYLPLKLESVSLFYTGYTLFSQPLWTGIEKFFHL